MRRGREKFWMVGELCRPGADLDSLLPGDAHHRRNPHKSGYGSMRRSAAFLRSGDFETYLLSLEATEIKLAERVQDWT